MLASPFSPLSQSRHQAIRRLHKKSEREAERLFFIEGEKLCREALTAHAPLEYVVLSSDAAESTLNLADELHEYGVPVYTAPAPKFQQICDAATPQGMVAVVRFLEGRATSDLAALPIIALDGVADPGNVGTIIRTADWFGLQAIVLGVGCADRYNPKVLRATMGSVFHCAVLPVPNLAHTLRHEFPQYRFYGASLQASQALESVIATHKQHDERFNTFGIVLGSEAHGISPELASVLAGEFAISGAKSALVSSTGSSAKSGIELYAESLNVAVAAGIICHEVFAAFENEFGKEFGKEQAGM